MTTGGPIPDGALGGSGATGIEAYGQKTQDEYKSEMAAEVTGGTGGILAFAADVPILGDLVESITGQEDGDYSDLGSFVSLLLGRDASLASRVAAIENKIAVGAEFFENFKRGDNETTLGSARPVANDEGPAIAPWIQFGDGEPMGIRDQAAQVRRNALPDDGTRYARCPFTATSNDYRVAVVINPNGTPPNPRTSIYGRCNSDMTAGIYVDFFGDRTALGRFTRSGLSMTRTQLAITTTKRYSNSSTPELRMTGGRYQVVIDDVTILDYTDSAYTPDATRRTSGFSLSVWTGILAVPQFSPGLASFSVRSNEITAVQQATAAAQQATETANAVVDTAVTEATNAANTAVGAVQTQLDTGLAAVNGRIDSLAGGVQQYTFSTTGTFTKPAGATRISVSLIGGGAGGSRYRGLCTAGGSGGWTKWYEFLGSEVPASVTVTVGPGGVGGTADNQFGTSGGDTTFGSLLSVGGGKCLAGGPVNGYGTELYYQGNGGRGGFGEMDSPTYSAQNGGNGPFSTGGLAGGTPGSGAWGNHGTSPGTNLVGPGSGGAGGQQKNGTGNGGNGGNGGYPGGGAGGGGNYVNFGTQGNGGNGGGGLVVVRVYFN